MCESDAQEVLQDMILSKGKIKYTKCCGDMVDNCFLLPHLLVDIPSYRKELPRTKKITDIHGYGIHKCIPISLVFQHFL